MPYLKRNEKLEITVVAEGLYIPKAPAVAIRSPNKIKIIAEERGRQAGRPFMFVMAGVVAAIVGVLVPLLVQSSSEPSSSRDVLTFAASVSGLPKLAEAYATSSSGDL
jgi:hypothetical protein